MRFLSRSALLTLSALAMSAALVPATSLATPVSYQIEFTVDSVAGALDPGNCSPGQGSGAGGFNCSVAVGDTYFGEFSIDDALLTEDGENLAALVYDFVIEIAGVVWDYLMNDPNSVFEGFRGPGGLGADSPGFDVADGEVVNLRGGVYGPGDAAYVDFSPLGPDGGLNRFAAGDGRTFAYGDMLIARIPEPPTWALIVIGLFALAMRKRFVPAVTRRRQP
jgi:hypothetical protein